MIPFRMRVDLVITDKALGGLMPGDQSRIQQKVAARMMAEGRRALFEELGIAEPRGNVIEGEGGQRPYPFVIDNRESPCESRALTYE